jgi:lipoyl synthase
MTLRVRWLGRVPYREAWAVQRALHQHSSDDHLLLLEHPHVFTVHRESDLHHVLVTPEEVGADLVFTDRGGDVTYHGPGQLVGYPIITVPTRRVSSEPSEFSGSSEPSASAVPRVGMSDTRAYVRSIEQLIIDALSDLGLPRVGRLDRYPGVWADPDSDNPRKICAIGVRLVRGRSMHGFALNIAPDMRYWDYIVPCGIRDKAVTSLAAEGIDVTMRDVVDAVAGHAAWLWGNAGQDPAIDPPVAERQDAVWRHVPDDLSRFTLEAEAARRGAPSSPPVDDAPPEGTGAPGQGEPAGVSVRLRGRLAEAGVAGGLSIGERKPPWLRSQFRTAPGYMNLKRIMRDLDLVTVCEEAGCPNIFDCWADGTATFMINGERCTRACGFCLVDTRHPLPLDADEPDRVAEAVQRMGLRFAVVTAVARDDLPDGGAGAFAATIEAIRLRTPGVQVEVLIPDLKGDETSLATVFDARPDVLNHNLETVLRLQRAVRPSAAYARSLAVLALAKEAGLTTKSGLIVGLGETDKEVLGALADLRAVGVDIVTVGQYLRPTARHLPVARWVEPGTFDAYAEAGHAMGIPHVEASPLTRSSYHARQAADSVAVPVSSG